MKKDRERLAGENHVALGSEAENEESITTEWRLIEEWVTHQQKNTLKWIRHQLHRREGKRDEPTRP